MKTSATISANVFDDAKLEEIARGGIEHGSSEWGPDTTEDEIYDDAYCLAFDALLMAGTPGPKAREIAGRVAQLFAQP